jgi:hypothetical protein
MNVWVAIAAGQCYQRRRAAVGKHCVQFVPACPVSLCDGAFGLMTPPCGLVLLIGPGIKAGVAGLDERV